MRLRNPPYLFLLSSLTGLFAHDSAPRPLILNSAMLLQVEQRMDMHLQGYIYIGCEQNC